MVLNHQVHQEHQDMEHQEPCAALDAIASQIVDSCFPVHKDLGPGLLENAYEIFLIEELVESGLDVKSQFPVQVRRKHKTVDMAYRLDLLIEDQIIIELKSAEKLLPIHQAQLMTYLRLTHKKLGFLVNFNTRLIKDGIRRIVL
jgi:GxxExxY protein